MTSEQRSSLVLAFARVLYVNGQATEQTVAAAEQLGRILGLQAKVMPRWGELQLRSDDENGRVISEVAADPTGVDMDHVASAARAISSSVRGGLRQTPRRRRSPRPRARRPLRRGFSRLRPGLVPWGYRSSSASSTQSRRC